MVKLSAEDKRWRADRDAEALALYQEIMLDPSRKNAAIKAAKSKANELNKRAKVMQYAAGGKMTKRKK